MAKKLLLLILLIATVTCDYPEINDHIDSIRVSGSSNPALEGTSIKFHCPPGQELTGSESTTCMANGEWKPDPRNITCNESKHYYKPKPLCL